MINIIYDVIQYLDTIILYLSRILVSSVFTNLVKKKNIS